MTVALARPRVVPPTAGLTVWLDGRYPQGRSAANPTAGDPLATWTDTTPNVRDATQTTAARRAPWQSSGWCSYDGVDDYHSLAAAGLMRNVAGSTVYVLASCTGTAATQQGLYLAQAGVSGTRFTLRRLTTGRLLVGGRRVDSDGFTSVDTGFDVRDVGWRLYGATLDYVAGTYQAHVNGEPVGAQGAFATSGGNSADTDSAQGHYIGSGGSASDFLSGNIATVLIYHVAHTAQEQRAVALAVSRGWGLT